MRVTEPDIVRVGELEKEVESEPLRDRDGELLSNADLDGEALFDAESETLPELLLLSDMEPLSEPDEEYDDDGVDEALVVCDSLAACVLLDELVRDDDGVTVTACDDETVGI